MFVYQGVWEYTIESRVFNNSTQQFSQFPSRIDAIIPVSIQI